MASTDIPGADFKPAPLLVINTPEMLKIAGDPLRLNIMEILRTEALTVKQIAARLGQPTTKLYYHVAELEAAGFVTQVDTRIKSGIIEKYYRMSADSVTVDPALLNAPGGMNDVTGLISAIFQTTVEDMTRGLNAGLFDLSDKDQDGSAGGNTIITASFFAIRKENVSLYVKKFAELLKELADQEPPAVPGEEPPATVTYGCTIAFYPRFASANPKPTEEPNNDISS